MSSICGIFNLNGNPARPELIEKMTSVLDHFGADRTGTWKNHDSTVSLGQVMLFNTPESLHEILPFHHDFSRLTITADARIDNRDDLFISLAIPYPERSNMPDSLLILEAYQKWGSNCPKYLMGDFTFAIWDEREKHLFCARDQMGAKPLFYYTSPDIFLFATEMKGLFQITGRPSSLNQAWIIDSLTALVADKEYTPYSEMFRLMPGHVMIISSDKIIQERYWALDPEKEIHLGSEEEYVEAFREKLTEAVLCRTRSAYPVGCELSGGLDSSAVAALAARQTGEQGVPFITFSHVLGDDDATLGRLIKDEKEFADRLRQYAGIDHYRNVSSEGRGVIETLKQMLVVQDGLAMSNFYTFSDLLFESGQTVGIRSLLSGFGGDEGVSCEAGSYLHDLVDEKAWKILWQEFLFTIKHDAKFPAKGIAGKIILNTFPVLGELLRPVTETRRLHRKGSSAFNIQMFSLNPEFYGNANIHNRLETISRLSSHKNFRNKQFARIMHPHLPLRMEYSSIASSARGIEYRYPLLDIRLLEFHLAAPLRLKNKHGQGRYLFRKSVEGIVPPEIQWRTDKSGSTIPAFQQRLIRDVEEIQNLIDRSRNGGGGQYLDMNLLMARCERNVNWQMDPFPMRRGAFMSALMLLLYFELIE
ncbi:MAG: asparagine synthase-related protein [Desulfobacteraceae bacterium]